MFEDMAVSRLASLLSLGVQQTRKYLASLEGQGVVKKTRKRNPLTFSLSEKFEAETFPEIHGDSASNNSA